MGLVTSDGLGARSGAVHGLSPRTASSFIAVNCGALGEGVFESELFGHVKGAFTGAVRELVESSRFRQDLYYRLAVFPLVVPSLRERRADVPLLIAHTIERLRDRAPDGASLTCSSFAIRLMRNYDWPGNVRELMSVVERAAVDAGFGRIEAQHLPPELRRGADAGSEARLPGDPLGRGRAMRSWRPSSKRTARSLARPNC